MLKNFTKNNKNRGCKTKTGNIAKIRGKQIAIAVFLLLTITLTIFALPFVSAATYTFDTHAFLSVAPNPIGVGQKATLVFWLDMLPPLGTTGSWDASWIGLTVTVTKPDAKTETLGPFNSDPVGSAYVQYTPTQIGTYYFKCTYPGQTEAAYDAYYKPSVSRDVSLKVQEAQISEWPGVALPTDYWQRPIYAENREWWSISGNWLGAYATNPGRNTAYNASGRNGGFSPYTAAPDTAHIVWTKPIEFGGLMGGTYGGTGTSSYYTGREYEPKFFPPVIMQGRLYYNERLGSSGWRGLACVDLRTGEELWRQNATYITLGQIYNYKSPNQFGGIPYLWDTSGSTWKMYDAFTGDLILNIANASAGSVVMSPEGDMLVYVLNGAKNWLCLWNSSNLPGMLLGATGTEGWQWRPPTGKTLDWKTGIEWNVTVPDMPGSQTIAFIGDVILATAAPPEGFARAANWQMEAAYDVKTGQQLWVLNRTFPSSTTTWGLMGYIVDDIYFEYLPATTQWYAYDAKTGNKLWGPTEPHTNAWDMYNTGACVAYGKFYDQAIGGICAYDLETGKLIWNYTAGTSGFETVYGNWPFQQQGFTIADGKIFAATSHSHTEPLFRGAKLITLDAETGQQLWNISFWREGYGNMPAVADGYLVSHNCYDNQIYCFGQGLTATTVSVSPKISVSGNRVLIEGTVTDQSPGETCLGIPAAGTPAIADEDMTAWMEYLYMQKPRPNDATGVKVHLTAIDPNNNFQDIGTATSNALGNYAIEWTPPVPGLYTVTATFEGSGSYFRSQAGTSFSVSEAAAPAVVTPAPTATQPPVTPTSPTPIQTPVSPSPTQAITPPASASLTTTYLAIGAAVVVIVAVAAALILRRRRK